MYALGSAVFASLTSIPGKVGISGVESSLGTAIRTIVILIMSWMIVFVQGKQTSLKSAPKGELGYICLSGIATGASWLCYYKALQGTVAPFLDIDIGFLFSSLMVEAKPLRPTASR